MLFAPGKSTFQIPEKESLVLKYWCNAKYSFINNTLIKNQKTTQICLNQSQWSALAELQLAEAEILNL